MSGDPGLRKTYQRLKATNSEMAGEVMIRQRTL